jgi:hypothetical protein
MLHQREQKINNIFNKAYGIKGTQRNDLP